MTPPDDWFRSTDWGPAAEAAFEARLARARPYKRPQYRRLKATVLLGTGDPVKAAAGSELLEGIAADLDAYRFEKVTALSQLGAFEHDGGRPEAAERHLRAALSLAAATRGSGTNELEEVRLAEILLQRGGRADLAEAAGLIDRLTPSKPVILASRFRKCLAGARVALALGDADRAAEWARTALELAAATHSGLANHPRLGLVETDEPTRAWLRTVAGVGDPGLGPVQR
jgi:hypothetical protein